MGGYKYAKFEESVCHKTVTPTIEYPRVICTRRAEVKLKKWKYEHDAGMVAYKYVGFR